MKSPQEEAGQKGGKATLRKHGREYFQEIGRKGGKQLSKIIQAGKRALKLKDLDK